VAFSLSWWCTVGFSEFISHAAVVGCVVVVVVVHAP